MDELRSFLEKENENEHHIEFMYKDRPFILVRDEEFSFEEGARTWSYYVNCRMTCKLIFYMTTSENDWAFIISIMKNRLDKYIATIWS